MSFFQYIDNGKGPTKLFLGGVHGNEGKTSIKFIKSIKQDDLSCGQFYFYNFDKTDYISTLKKEYYQSDLGQRILKLIEYFPEIKDVYFEETSWQDGDKTGSHVVYADIFVPFIKSQILDGKEYAIAGVFHYIEKLLELNDEYANEVIALSVLESLLFDEDVNNAFFIEFAKPNTLELIQEIIQNLEE